MSSKKKEVVRGLPTADELRSALAASGSTPARAALSGLFDENTFVETAAYTKRGYHEFVSENNDGEFEGVITGYGSVNGRLVFAFAQDETRMKGAIDAVHADKIIALYRLALKKGAPVIGIFASNGAVVDEGVAALAAYGRLLKTVTDASSSILQIAYVIGNCTGTCAAIASAFDFVLTNDNAHLYVTHPELGGKELGAASVSFHGSSEECSSYIRSLIAFLPEEEGEEEECTDDLNRRLADVDVSDIPATVRAIADNGVYIEYAHAYGDAAFTAFTTIAGVKCGVVANVYANGNGRITDAAAYKILDFLNLCDSFALPVVTLADSEGLSADITVDAVRSLAFGYAQLDVPQVTVVLNHAIGAAFPLMGSKSMGADLAYALDGAEIGLLSSSAAVAFAWNEQISGDISREELEQKWRASVATAAAAAATGEIDDIISVPELRARIASALLMLTC